jgi:hypothetical protein
MKRQRSSKARLSGVLLAAMAVTALLVLPGLAASHDRNQDHPGDAGTIQSFDPETGSLAIDLTEGDTISGLVVDRTHIRCGKGRHHRRHLRRHRRRHHGQASASNRGPAVRGSDGSQDSDLVRGPKAGEDTPGHDGTPPGASEDPGQGAENSDRCTTDDLVEGTTVKVAELVLINGNAYFKLVALKPPAPVTT